MMNAPVYAITSTPYDERNAWPEPEPLTERTTAQPYPMHLLPGILGKAVQEAVNIVKCPPALAACSALSVLATAVQGVADVQPHPGLSPSPLSLFFLSIGDSGERKSTADAKFSKALNSWIMQKEEELEPKIQEYRAEHRSWQRQRTGIERAIEDLAKKGEDTGPKTHELAKLEQMEPEPVYVPSLAIEDITPEAVGYDLVHKWPSAGILSSEAGSVFGGHGMKADSITRTLALFNKLWSGEYHKVTRRGADPYHIRDVRLSMGLAVQPAVIRDYHDKHGELARGSGFFARYLLAWPESTQGARLLSEADLTTTPNTNSLNLFYARLHEILNLHYENGKGGKLQDLPALQLDPDAKHVWLDYFNDVERELLPTGDMEQCKDIASKSADNAARLAGLFHLFNGGAVDALIDGKTMREACILASWHLYEARRFFGEVALPAEDLALVKLDSWLINQCRANDTDSIGKSQIMQFITPASLRKAKVLNTALDTLQKAGRIRLGKEGRTSVVEINPALLES